MVMLNSFNYSRKRPRLGDFGLLIQTGLSGGGCGLNPHYSGYTLGLSTLWARTWPFKQK
jgi:hypothetical protein